MKSSMGESLHKLTYHHRNKMREAVEASGIHISVSHIRTLKCIKHINNCNASDIACHLFLDKSQVTRLLKELVSNKYVEKAQDPKNHRSQLLSLTSTGDQLLIKITKLHMKIIEKMTTGLTDKQIQDFMQITDVMAKNLQQAASKKSGA